MDRKSHYINWILLLFFVSGLQRIAEGQNAGSLYRGKYIGRFTERKHAVSGDVYAVDSRTLHIRSFTYDGTGPDAFFWIGFTDHPSPKGIIVPNEKGSREVLRGYSNRDITITLPDGLTLRDIKWIAVWCRAYEVNFADLYIPKNFDFPQPHDIGSLSGQGVSSGPIVVVDAQTILVSDFKYQGQVPDLQFWVGKGSPNQHGTPVPDETGSQSALLKTDQKTMVLNLPGDLTIFDIDYFGLYSQVYNKDFGYVRVPKNLNVPPSLRMLGITPQHPVIQVTLAPVTSTLQPLNVQYISDPAYIAQPQITKFVHQPVQVEAVPQQHQYYDVVQPKRPLNAHSSVAINTGTSSTNYQHLNSIIPTVSSQNLYSGSNGIVTYQTTAPLTYEVANHAAQVVTSAEAGGLAGTIFYKAPLTSSSTIVSPASASQVAYTPLGSNGFASYTIRTSKGSSTSQSLY